MVLLLSPLLNVVLHTARKKYAQRKNMMYVIINFMAKMDV